jgi:mRNA interferase MazF
LGLKQGDIVTVAPPGDFGKPRPALILQKQILPETVNITVALITSDLLHLSRVRVSIEPTAENGLHLPSQIMLDNVQTFKKQKIGKVLGAVDELTMDRVMAALLAFVGLV